MDKLKQALAEVEDADEETGPPEVPANPDDYKLATGEIDVTKRNTDDIAKRLKSYNIAKPGPLITPAMLLVILLVFGLGIIVVIFQVTTKGVMHPVVGLSSKDKQQAAVFAFKAADKDGDGHLTREEILGYDSMRTTQAAAPAEDTTSKIAEVLGVDEDELVDGPEAAEEGLAGEPVEAEGELLQQPEGETAGA